MTGSVQACEPCCSPSREPMDCGTHVSHLAGLACRLVDGFTWDALLSTVGTMSLNYKVLRGTWFLGMAAAAARLEASCSLTAETGGAGSSWVHMRSTGHGSDMSEGCGPSCGACLSCLMAAQVDTPGCL